MFVLFAAFAEFERNIIRERTMAGLAAARARGRIGGRPRKHPKPDGGAMGEVAAITRTVVQDAING